MGRTKKEINPLIGKRIHEAIEYSGLSRREVSRRLDYGDSNIKRLEDGNGEPPMWFMSELSAITGVRIQFLYGIDDFKTIDDIINFNINKRQNHITDSCNNFSFLLNACGYSIKTFCKTNNTYILLPSPPIPDCFLSNEELKARKDKGILYEQLDNEWELLKDTSVKCICTSDNTPVYELLSTTNTAEVYDDCIALIETLLDRAGKKGIIKKILPHNDNMCPCCSTNINIVADASKMRYTK